MKKRGWYRMLAAGLACALVPILCACGEKTSTRTLYAMDTVLSLSVQGEESVLDELAAIVFRQEKDFSVTDENSAVYALNATGEGVFSDEEIGLLTRALSLCAYTDGAFDITIYPVVKKWGFTTGAYAVPTDEELAALLPLVDYRSVTMEGNTVCVPQGVMIDLGGVAKGYLGDCLRERCLALGVNNAIFNLGGNVVAVGEKKKGTPWRVAITDADEQGYLGVLEVTDTNVVTSGAYERYFEKDGVRYGHILDPDTGRPATGLTSVTVVGTDGTECDALGTALYVMGPEKAKAFCLANGVQAVLQDETGKIYVTKELSRSFTADGRYTVEVIG